MEDIYKNKRIGPQITIIPEQKYYSCWGCKYYDYFMLRSGLNPLYIHNCKKMNIEGNELDDDNVKYNTSPYLLDDGKTPPICPYIKIEQRNDKLNDLGV
jgi:hypothetical protein